MNSQDIFINALGKSLNPLNFDIVEYEKFENKIKEEVLLEYSNSNDLTVLKISENFPAKILVIDIYAAISLVANLVMGFLNIEKPFMIPLHVLAAISSVKGLKTKGNIVEGVILWTLYKEEAKRMSRDSLFDKFLEATKNSDNIKESDFDDGLDNLQESGVIDMGIDFYSLKEKVIVMGK